MIRTKNAKLAYTINQDGSGSTGSMAEYFGTSSDTKPTEGVVTGSTFQEVDTGDLYFYNEDNSTWVKKNESGGGGSSDFSTAKVTLKGTNVEAWIPSVYEAEGSAFAYPEAAATPAGYELTAILYKGACVLCAPNATLSSTDSTCEIDGDTALITGDCTITIS